MRRLKALWNYIKDKISPRLIGPIVDHNILYMEKIPCGSDAMLKYVNVSYPDKTKLNPIPYIKRKKPSEYYNTPFDHNRHYDKWVDITNQNIILYFDNYKWYIRAQSEYDIHAVNIAINMINNGVSSEALLELGFYRDEVNQAIKMISSEVYSTDEKVRICPFCKKEMPKNITDCLYPSGDNLNRWRVICDEMNDGCGISVIGDTPREAINNWDNVSKAWRT